MKLKYTCSGQTQYATCVKYEGDVNSQSSLVNEDCLDLDQTTEDIYEQIEKLQNASDLSDLGEGCLSYVQEEGKTIVKNVLLKYEEEICALKLEVEKLKTTAICDMDITDCNLNFHGLVDECGEQPKKLKEVLQLILTEITA